MFAEFPTAAWLAALPWVLLAQAALVFMTWLVGRAIRRFAQSSM